MKKYASLMALFLLSSSCTWREIENLFATNTVLSKPDATGKRHPVSGLEILGYEVFITFNNGVSLVHSVHDNKERLITDQNGVLNVRSEMNLGYSYQYDECYDVCVSETAYTVQDCWEEQYCDAYCEYVDEEGYCASTVHECWSEPVCDTWTEYYCDAYVTECDTRTAWADLDVKDVATARPQMTFLQNNNYVTVPAHKSTFTSRTEKVKNDTFNHMDIVAEFWTDIPAAVGSQSQPLTSTSTRGLSVPFRKGMERNKILRVEADGNILSAKDAVKKAVANGALKKSALDKYERAMRFLKKKR